MPNPSQSLLVRLQLNLSDGQTKGTIATLCQDATGNYYLLTCGHVVVHFRSSQLLIDRRWSIPFGVAANLEPKPGIDAAQLDAALIDIDATLAKTLMPLYPTLLSAGQAGAPVLSDETVFVQTSHGVVRGIVIAHEDNFPILVERDDGNQRAVSQVVRMAVRYRPESTLLDGDSGAAVWNARDELVGIHCGVTQAAGEAYFCKTSAIADRFQIQYITKPRASTGPSASPTLAGTASPPIPLPSDEQEALARTIWGEAGELGNEAMQAVAAVALARRKFGKWMGCNMVEVCHKPYQFRCWDATSSTIKRMLLRSEQLSVAEQSTLKMAQTIAEQALANGIQPDPTKGATRYHPDWIVPPPAWVGACQPCARIGGLSFYNDIDL
ncbi:spore germination cell wall hydrolase CwlJ-like protein [Chitinivorax tropicus]|uniref:Spore germination cell wall hydrolase CwlJ-like protein n=1 Tax=Chitinivorax tropicus TaxID=714531 RepID=A0A840MT75_9PROT|nr:cell wall hydrolase [Chitinivorax tropicus]MBB5019982.1 spore germination cell wall hydrolase CwlJ-like protein [Chitinivorax tropicus]